MELKIDPEAVNKLVADAVLNSAIGEAVKKAVEIEIANMNRSYDNPISAVVRNYVADMVRQVIIAKYEPTIRAKIAAALAEKLSLEFIERVCDRALERY